MVRLNALSTIVPEHAIATDETVRFFERHCPETVRARLARSIATAGNRRRYAVLPLDELARLGGAGARAALYRRHAEALAERAVGALADVGTLHGERVSAVIFVSSTGFAAPSIDAHVVRRFGLAACRRRIPLAQLGCGGGVAAFSLATELIARDPSARVLVVSVELPSLHLQLAEPSYTELLSAAQFGDGAAAAVLSSDGAGPEVLGTGSALLPEVDEGGRILPCETGFRLVASSGLPDVIRRRARELVRGFADANGVDADALAFVAAHPRGRAVLDAVAEGLAVDPSLLAAGYDAWEDGGNMVSASIYRVLAALARRAPAHDDVGAMLAFGTGLACEAAFLRWDAAPDVTTDMAA